jgi:acyl-CoA reductase-like NAD-dependent aldehyde dehydrogenase
VQTASDYKMFVHGEWRSGSGETIAVVNPSTGRPFATVPEATAEDLDGAVASARAGLAEWSQTDPRERAAVLNRIATTLKERAGEFAALHAENSGASIATGLWTMNDVAARRFEYYAGMADKLRGDTFVSPGQFFGYTLREPIGVTAHIIPWNGPLWIGTRTIAPALAAGNAVVAKPSSEAPLTLLEFAALAAECGLPPGAFNVVTGRGGTLGEKLSSHPGIDAIYFTGSTATAKMIARASADRDVRTVFELGGKSPNIIFEDADLDAALPNAIFGIFANAGQICASGSRLLVQESIHDEFVARLVEQAEQIVVGGPDNEQALMGPLISAHHKQTVLDYIAKGSRQAELVTGGGEPGDPSLQDGFFVEPTIFDRVPNDAVIAQEEIFGPVLAVTTFADEDEAVALANDSAYGLAAAVWTADVARAHVMAQRLEAAEVFINHYFSSTFELSRSPYKASGHGMSEGPDAIYEYLTQKAVSVKIGEAPAW